MICGSMHFAKEMQLAKIELEKMNYEVLLPGDINNCLEDTELKASWENNFEDELKHCLALDLLNDGLQKIARSDAVLILNYPKNGISGYIGASGLMEIGVAFFLSKKIFLLYPVDRQQKYALEVELTKPVVLNGDLGKIILSDTLYLDENSKYK